MDKRQNSVLTLEYIGTNKAEIEALVGLPLTETTPFENKDIKALIADNHKVLPLSVVIGDTIIVKTDDDGQKRISVAWGIEHIRHIRSKRQEANRIILDILKELVECYPQQRFGQIITNYVFPDYRSHDIFFDESVETLETLTNVILNIQR